MIHELKTWPEYFAAVILSLKTAEVRLNNRDFRPGDTLILKEFDRVKQAYTGRFAERIVSHVQPLEDDIIGKDWVLLSFKRKLP